MEGSFLNQNHNYKDIKNDLQNQNLLMMDLKQFIVQTIDGKFRQFETEIRREIKEMVCDIRSLQGHTKKLQSDLLLATEGLSDAIIKTDKNRVKNMDIMKVEFSSENKIRDQKIDNTQNKLQELENQILLTETRLKESAIRLRGMSEDCQDLKEACVEALAGLLRVKPDEIACKIDQAYRVNSYVATTKKLPRDVVVHFTEKSLRNSILQKSYVMAPQIAGKKIQVFKELPSGVLLQRKRFGFLVKQLKEEKIPFRWNLPVGIIFWYQGKRYQLNNIQEAEKFCKEIFSAAVSTSQLLKQNKVRENMPEDSGPPTIQEEVQAKDIQKEERGVILQKPDGQEGFKQAKNKKWKRRCNSKKRHF